MDVTKQFEWDDAKNVINIRKHGIDFVDATEVFEHPMLILRDDREYYDEERWTGIGLMQMHTIVVVYVEKHNNIIRLISARKATRREIKHYEETI
jgi:hypothetical protein